MEIINISKGGLESGLEGAVIAIGNFDGVHKGHQQIINKVRALGARDKRPAGILTFEPNPIEYFLKEIKHYQLTSFKQKAAILESLGLDFVAYAEFNEALSKVTAENFIEDILIGKMKVGYVFTGDDFNFGYRAQGNAKLLAKKASELGFGYTAVEKITDKAGERFSSTHARRLLGEGRPEDAAEIMGREFEISGVVKKGKELGRTLGFPTANIQMGNYALPKLGIYKCDIIIDGKTHAAVASVGVNPTTDERNEPIVEVYIHDFDKDIYGKNVAVRLNSFLREEMKFKDTLELKRQIEKDVAAALRK